MEDTQKKTFDPRLCKIPGIWPLTVPIWPTSLFYASRKGAVTEYGDLLGAVSVGVEYRTNQ
ncbi:unnamed protein product [Fusarium graminearum]|nr:unnamed protein product [Fusarium graminearum]